MPRIVSRSTLVTRIRRRANLENAPFFINDLELQEMIDESAAALYDKYVIGRGQEYYRSSVDIPLIPGTGTYDLPADFYKPINVLSQQNGTWVDMFPWDAHDLDVLLNQRAYGIVQFYYRLTGLQVSATLATPKTQIEIQPVPGSAWLVRVLYVPVVSNYVTAGDVNYDCQNGWEDWIVWNCVAQCKDKGEEDPSFALGERSAADQRIMALIDRDAGNVQKVVDSRRSRLGGARDGFFGLWRASAAVALATLTLTRLSPTCRTTIHRRSRISLGRPKRW